MNFKSHLKSVSPSELAGHQITLSLVMSEDRMTVFQNRKYVITTLLTWLRRLKPNYHQNEMHELISWLENIKLRGHFHICFLIAENADKFHSIAPGLDPADYFQYKNIITPVIEYCTGESNNANTIN
ncbi:hypothetical protein [Pedobacter antarcticus]|uniref:hypothetical protein n=1 Tax=Pedobacter antarcticus TaxID=34086 RepID=UPI000882D7D6|nr:hypothetical protein [Pedobacter antarcticus]SDM39644.1 hypothetical protein SAMN04488084_106141 [Pedobacter antarcticus]